MLRLAVLVLLLASPPSPPSPPSSEVSYRSLTNKKAEAAFYKCGGRSHRNRRVHLHVPAARLHARPKKILKTRRGGRLLLFENRSVPLLVYPRNVYFRKILRRTRPGDRICVKGRVMNEPLGGRGRYAILVKTLKTAPK